MNSHKQKEPSEKAIQHLLAGLYGDELQVSQLEKPFDSTEDAVVGTYKDDALNIRRIVTCDIALANRLGAALTMYPPRGADDAIKEKVVSDKYLENLREVLNISVNMFGPAASQLVLGDVVNLSAKETRPDVSEVSRTSFEVSIPRYGDGRLSIEIVA